MSDFNMEDKNYNNGTPIDTDSLNEEEWKECAREWSEGDKNLESLIYFCFQKGLKTVASCSGHNGKTRPYISFLNNEKNKYIIDSIAAEFGNIKGAGIAFISGSLGSDGRKVNPFTTFYMPMNDTSGFCGIKRICNDILNGKKYEIDKNLALFRQITEKIQIDRFGSYIQYECGIPMKAYLDNFKTNPIEKKMGKHIFINTVNQRFKKNLRKLNLIKNGDADSVYYTEQTEDNKEQINSLFTGLLERLKGKDYEISNNELEQIARRPKNISIQDVFEKLSKRVKTFLGKDKTKEENELGEENDRNSL